ncbi:D123-domain-containing protein [Lipomyces arxii]|uniref:D123-domain-containing protein n=1 Tax=Lipomyces arxii TaxID=56418 RepID=UPI0034CEAAAA
MFGPNSPLSPPASPPPVPSFPDLTVAHVRNCVFSSWHARYRKLTPKATVIKPVDTGFVEYLLADGIFLPPEGERAEWSSESDEEVLSNRIQELSATSRVPGSDSGSSVDWSGDDEDVNKSDPAIAFPELDAQIRKVLDNYDALTPKLNWSSPRDATWITTTNTLKCVTPGDVYLILKSSNFITHDLLRPFDDCTDATYHQLPHHEVELVLRKWVEFNPAMEFRAFVRNRTVLGMSQRAEHHYQFLEPLNTQIKDLILDFFDDNLRQTFPDENFCFDVYIPKPETRRVWLIDINPFAQKTDSLLYDWTDLLTIDPLVPDFDPDLRLVSADEGVHSFSTKPFSAHMVPRDVVDASVQGGGAGIAAFAKQWKDMLDKSKSTP